MTSEELILRNTFINAQMGPLANFNVDPNLKKPKALKWIDENDTSRTGKDALRENDFKEDLLVKPVVPVIDIHRNKKPEDIKRSLKMKYFTLVQTTGVPNIISLENSQKVE